MKKVFAFICVIAFSSVVVFGQVDSTEVAEPAINWLDAIIDLWPAILTILSYIIYRLIPTKRADVTMSVLNWIINLVPDEKKGGGTH